MTTNTTKIAEAISLLSTVLSSEVAQINHPFDNEEETDSLEDYDDLKELAEDYANELNNDLEIARGEISNCLEWESADPLDQDGGVVSIYAKETSGPDRRWIGINTADPFDGVWPLSAKNSEPEESTTVGAVFDINAAVDINTDNASTQKIFRVQGTAGSRASTVISGAGPSSSRASLCAGQSRR